MQPDLDLTDQPTENEKFTISAANGTVLYVLAYTFVYAVHQAVKVALSAHYHLRFIWNISQIKYTMADNEWWRSAIIAVHGVGPFVCTMLGFAAYRWYWAVLRGNRGLFKLLILWIALHCCNLVLGALLADTFTQSGFWYVPSWVFQLGNVPNIVLAFFAGLGQLAIGYFVSTAFLQAHDSKTVMRYQNRQRMVVYTLLFPFLFGTLIIGFSKAPNLFAHRRFAPGHDGPAGWPAVPGLPQRAVWLYGARPPKHARGLGADGADDNTGAAVALGAHAAHPLRIARVTLHEKAPFLPRKGAFLRSKKWGRAGGCSSNF